MSQALGQATGRFRDTMGELRRMTGQIQQELEATRAELRRGVVELPQETHDAAAQMRRVVADQIKALNELASLVSRSNRAVDAAPAVQPRRVNETPAPAPAPAGAGSGSGRRPGAAASTPPRAPRSPHPAQPVPAPERPTLRQEASAPPRDAGHPRRLAVGPPEPRLAGRGRAGPAARRRRPNGPPRVASLASLDTLSGDIARMVDHDATAEAWDRYKQGERNVFTRRLYTLQGQQTFDEIRRKYRGDTEFRQTVDRYVEEFERLLAEVSRDDRDQVLSKTYLTSETGKVYTMLAHASGRFD